jgi:hypothetical protein
MDEFVCVTLCSHAGESEAAFKARLTAFWTHMLRNQPDDYEQVYAEGTEFETEGNITTRQYMVTIDGVTAIEAALKIAKLDYQPIDPDDTYNKHEASSSDWFQIDH